MPLNATPIRPVRSRRPWYLVSAIVVTLACALMPVSGHSVGFARGTEGSTSSYSNPIIAQNAADPSIIKALDGFYYIAASSDYWTDGSYHILPIFRSTDMVNWTFVTDALPARPAWAADDAGLWAPDLRYFNHKYYMYYMAEWTKSLPQYGTNGGSAIGVATADTPSGPWTDVGPSAGSGFSTGPVIPPRPCAFNTDPPCYYWTFDPAEFTDHTGQRYLYYGSYFGGTLVQPLASDGMHTAGSAIQIGHWDRYEGTYVVRHDVNGQPYYYNFSSAANCCLGPNTGYSVSVNRSNSPTGTFTDQNGFPMLYPGSTPAPTTRPSYDPGGDNKGNQGGGYPTLKQNGNKWHGVGHNALMLDLSGHQWIVYHGVDRNNGWLNSGPHFRITLRQVLLDRIDWTADGWPVVNGGSGPSETNTGPVTTPQFGDNFNSSACTAPNTAGSFSSTWTMPRGSWAEVRPGSCKTGGYASSTSTNGVGLMVSGAEQPTGSRTECDLQLVAGTGGQYGCVVDYQRSGASSNGRGLVFYIDTASHSLVAGTYANGHIVQTMSSTPLPSNFDATDWHHLAIDELSLNAQHQPVFRATLSDRDEDILAQVQTSFPPGFTHKGGSVGFFTQNARANFDNITTASFNDGTVQSPQAPPTGTLLPAYSDEFNGSLGPQWTWIREDKSKHAFVGGELSITVNGDLYRNANNATNLLVENQPSGDYVMETKIRFDPNSNYQAAGLLVYSDDDHYIKDGPAHLDSLNKIEAGKESLEPLPAWETNCDVQPSPSSNVAIDTYTRDQCPNEGEAWDYLTNPAPTENGSTAPDPQVVDWLRIYRHGNVYTPYTSLDGTHWVKGQTWEMQAVSSTFPVKIGLFAFSGGPNNNVPALFDYVHVYTQP